MLESWLTYSLRVGYPAKKRLRSEERLRTESVIAFPKTLVSISPTFLKTIKRMHKKEYLFSSVGYTSYKYKRARR